MKKTYQKTVVTVVEIQATRLLMQRNEERETVQH